MKISPSCQAFFKAMEISRSTPLSSFGELQSNSLSGSVSPDFAWLACIYQIYTCIYQLYTCIYQLTRATLMSPGKDKARVCGYIYIYI